MNTAAGRYRALIPPGTAGYVRDNGPMNGAKCAPSNGRGATVADGRTSRIGVAGPMRPGRLTSVR
jgi:hypothetical protein